MQSTLKIVFALIAILLGVLRAASVQATTVTDSTRAQVTAAGVSAGSATSTPTISCDSKVSWTCLFTATDDLSNRYVDNVGLAHINKDGSVYLQELSDDSSDDYWSATLPAWYVSNGLTGYKLIGTDCTFTITPTVGTNTVTEWVLSIVGKTVTTTSGTGRNATTTTVSTCGGDGSQTAGGRGKHRKVKAAATGKGPGPK